MARLNAAATPRSVIAVLAVLMLAGHLAAADWLAPLLRGGPGLEPMPEALYTRMLAAQTPPPPAVSEAKRPVQRSQTHSPAIETVAKSVAEADTQTAASVEPAPAAPPAAESPQVAQAPAVPAPEAAAAPASAGSAAATDAWPPNTRMSYFLGGRFRGDITGSAQVEWRNEGGRYQASVLLDVGIASMAMTSQGEITARQLVPRIYEERRPGGRIRTVRMDDGTVQLNNGRGIARPEGLQDTASQFVELAQRFATGRTPLEAGRTVDLWLARPGGVDAWTYDVVGKEAVATQQFGTLEAFHLKPRPLANPRGNITAEMWFAPSLQYLPVRIRIAMGEEGFVDLLVQKIER